MSSTYFLADTHFRHENIIKYTKRPFSSVIHMDKILIANWNSVVGPDDEVKTVWSSAPKSVKLQPKSKGNGNLRPPLSPLIV